MPALKCDGGKDSWRWVGTTGYPSGKTAWNCGGAAAGLWEIAAGLIALRMLVSGRNIRGVSKIDTPPCFEVSKERFELSRNRLTVVVKCYLMTFFPLVITTPL